ncbi:MAG TPA: P27 family phage terminase small subunit [Solirubrobacteraceae bacterium]|nr:P27 family phage terminase small subunit [Solirubrobacteraceae bacterium]
MTAGASANGHGRVVPEPPADLEAPGREVWSAAWALPRVQACDAGLVLQLARLRDEESRLRAAIAADGAVLSQPVQSATGEVIGTSARLHPGLAMLRRIGREAVEAASELGLSPAGRRRLGMAMSPRRRVQRWRRRRWLDRFLAYVSATDFGKDDVFKKAFWRASLKARATPRRWSC